MKIYNEDKTIELTLEECDLTRGYITEKQEIIHHDAIEGVEEKGHYEVVAEYPETGGRDVEWIIDIPGVEAQPAWEETVSYQVYHLYSEEELLIKEYEAKIEEYQKELTASDFQAIKYAEGFYTEAEYKPIKDTRQSYRNDINILRAKIRELQKETQEK